MKQINNFILEKLKVNSKSKINNNIYEYQPKTWTDLHTILIKRLKENKNANFNDIDISKIKDLQLLFVDLDPHNIRIDNWNVSNVTNMTAMFKDCSNFNCDLSNWDVSKVKDFRMMFAGCTSFDCDLNKWDVSNANYFGLMFQRCSSLKNKPIWYPF